MLKILVALRTVFFVFLLGYTLRTLPWGWSRTFDEEFARCTATRAIAIQAVWIAIAWLAFDTAVGWWMASRQRKSKADDAPRSGEPPLAPPPPPIVQPPPG